MAVKQSCNDCDKQSTCPKAAHFENYSLDGCMDFKEKLALWVKTQPRIDDEGIWMPLSAYVPEGHETNYQLILTKEIFIEAYNKWIKGDTDE